MNGLEQLLFDQIEKRPDGDWAWTGKTRGENRGYVSLTVYRLMWLLYKGPIPEGAHLDHLCGNPNCVNPDHLEPVTAKENFRRGNGWAGKNFRKTHCPRGHEYNEANTYLSKVGKRHCKVCQVERSREWMTEMRRRTGMPERQPKGSRTHCPHGHEYTPENTYISPKGDKVCRTCKREKGREWMRQRRRTHFRPPAPNACWNMRVS